MAKFDPKKYGYHNLMDPEAGAVAYPDELKRDTWRKEKGKLCPETGLGKLLDKCEQAFQGVNWQSFNATTIDLLDKEEERLEKWYKGAEIKGYSSALQDVADLAKKKAAELKKAKLVPKAAGEAAQKVFDAADWLTVTLNKESMGGMLREAKEACKQNRLKAARETAGQNIPSAKLVRDNFAKRLKAIGDNLQAYQDDAEAVLTGKIGNGLRDYCRAMTQPLGNFLKAQIAGASYQNLNAPAITKLFKAISVVGNTTTWTQAYTTKKRDLEDGLEQCREWSDEFTKLTTPIAMPS